MNDTAHPAAKLITCILPDDGRDRRLIRALHQRGVYSANSFQCRGTEPGTGRRSKTAVKPLRVVTVVVALEQADELFGFICSMTNIGRSGSGLIYQGGLETATPFFLPVGVPEETTH